MFVDELIYDIQDNYRNLREARVRDELNTNTDNKPPVNINVPLPKIDVPVFGRQIDEWPNFKALFDSLIHNTPFIFSLLLNHTDYFEKLMVNLLNRKICVNDGLGISNVVTSRNTRNRSKNSMMWNCKHCWTYVDDFQTQKQLTKQLDVDQ